MICGLGPASPVSRHQRQRAHYSLRANDSSQSQYLPLFLFLALAFSTGSHPLRDFLFSTTYHPRPQNHPTQSQPASRDQKLPPTAHHFHSVCRHCFEQIPGCLRLRT
ncbi:hypothetical protein CGRA01v4_06873 [Colletotrichum graminicola]|nr:hypothetical protein CGRA01v4_06873 [Colletotrichum graminicola]